MNKIFVVLVALLVGSCNNAPKSDSTEKDSLTEEMTVVDSMCYIYTNNHNDTVTMRIINSNEKVSGTLIYNYFEKDKNSGTLAGNMFGDTLIAQYQFISEGVQSVREVAFVKKNNTFLQGYGDMIEEGNKLKFKNRNNLVFDTANILQETSCE